jgi:hypothetical protein
MQFSARCLEFVMGYGRLRERRLPHIFTGSIEIGKLVVQAASGM